MQTSSSSTNDFAKNKDLKLQNQNDPFYTI